MKSGTEPTELAVLRQPHMRLAPFFIVGCPRSGTTLLQRMLDSHPDIAVAPETHYIRRFWLNREKYGELRQNDGFFRLLSDIAAMREFSEMRLAPEEFFSRAAGGPRTHQHAFATLLGLFAERRGVRIVGEKTPNHLLYIRQLLRLFPCAKFIHLLRDPRAVVASWKLVPWSNGTVSKDAIVWRRYVRAADGLGWMSKSQLLTLRYESLVVNPAASLKMVCGFLGIGFDSRMLAFYAETGSVNLEREPWKHRVADPVDRASMDLWRRILAPEEIRAIESEVWWEMRKVGYAFMTPAPRLLGPAAYSTFSRAAKHLVRRIAIR